MEAADLIPLLDQLEDHVDDLEEALQPLLQKPLSATTKKLPVLDKAKFYVLITYTLESLLFSYLRLHGLDAREHPVFKELTRVKQYFEKIKALETEPEKRTMSLDKQAAGRFIKHSLSGNSKYDLERAEREAKEKAVAQLKAAMLAKKTAATPDDAPAQERSLSGSGSDSGSHSDSESSESDDEDESNAVQPAQPASQPMSEKKTTKEWAGASKERRRLSKDERREAQKDRRRKKYEVREARKVEKKRRKTATKAKEG
ncbi:hypothetical protein VTN02DRAFT_772 [Thermoascus thermophilus]